MKPERLSRSVVTDEVWREIQRLCRAQPPSAPPDPVAEARVLQRILRQPRRRAWRAPARVAVSLALLVLAASALAGVARKWLGPATSPRPLPPARATLPPSTSPTRAVAASPSLPEPPAPAPRAPHDATLPGRERIAERHLAHPLRALADAPLPHATPAVATPELWTAPSHDPARRPEAQESLLVYEAMRALRIEGRPRRARALLDDYLLRFPKGALIEDALALEMEAAGVARDAAAAQRWAERYGRDFPGGRFSALADSSLRRTFLPKGNVEAHP